MTIKEIIKQSSLDSFESEIILAFLLPNNREFILSHPEKSISDKKYKQFLSLEKKRLSGYAIAHLIEKKSFYSRSFIINKDTLIPRPLSELLVEEALKKIDKGIEVIIDIGTGSGAIIISIAKEYKKINLSHYRNLKFFASDISSLTLKITKKNIKKYHLEKKIIVKKSDLLEKFKSIRDEKILIVTNLPYLKTKEINKFITIKKEPRIALDGGSGGLKLYIKLFKEINKMFDKDIICLCEFDDYQKQKILKLAKNNIPKAKFKFLKDLSKKTRFLIIDKKKRS